MRTAKLGDICEFKPSKRLARIGLSEDDPVSFVPMNDLGIHQKYLTARDERPLSEVAGSYTYFAEGDVLLAKITPCFENGKLGIARGLTNGVGFGSSEFTVIRSGAEVLSEYVYYFLDRDDVRERGEKVMTGAVGHKRVPQEFVEALEIPLPPLEEQRRIVAVLDEAFAAIATATANAEKNLANARELFHVMLESVFCQTGPDWNRCEMSALIDITHGFAFKGPDFENGGEEMDPIVLTPGNYTEDSELAFTPRNTKRLVRGAPPNGFTFLKGDLTVVMTDLSSKMKILGRPAFVNVPGVLHNQRIGRIVFRNSSVAPELIYYGMQRPSALKSIRETATGTMVRHTAPKRILANTISYPRDPYSQTVLVARLNDIRREAKELREIQYERLKALAILKQSLLRRAFSGELTEREPLAA